jgi:hypothetical protein
MLRKLAHLNSFPKNKQKKTSTFRQLMHNALGKNFAQS